MKRLFVVKRRFIGELQLKRQDLQQAFKQDGGSILDFLHHLHDDELETSLSMHSAIKMMQSL
jgi:hypothetical protein